MTEFIPLPEFTQAKLCEECQAATDAANPFPREPGEISVYLKDGIWGFTSKPHSRPTKAAS